MEQDGEQLTLEELVNPDFCLSRSHNRDFFQQREYASAEEYDRSLAAAKAALPEATTAYNSSGKTNLISVVVLLIATPILFGIVFSICVALCTLYTSIEGARNTEDPSFRVSQVLGVVAIVLDLLLVAMMIFAPFFAFTNLSRLSKNRNPWLPSILTAFSSATIAILLFFPIWNGETLAPTDLTIIFIPIRWLLIGIGGILAPLFSAFAVFYGVGNQKFCEQSNVFLKEFRVLNIDFDFGENALEILRRGEYEAIAQLPKADDGRYPKHAAHTILWWDESAKTAFLELTIKFQGKFQEGKEMTEKEEEWLAFSVLLDRDRAQSIGQSFLTAT
jgi:hypothetical protein